MGLPTANKGKPILPTLLIHKKWSVVAVPAFSILLSLATASVILLLFGKNPLTAFASFLQGCGILPKAQYGGGVGQLTDFFSFLNILAPLLLAALGFAVGMKTGLFNIGISGQMLFSGFIATCLVGYAPLSDAVAKPLVILIGIVAGGLLGAFVGWLKYQFNIHEVVSTILLNYIISYITGFFITGYYVNPMTRTMQICSVASRLAWTKVEIGGVQCTVSLGIALALLAAVIVWFLFEKTVFGFQLKAVGSNIRCAKYAGISTGKGIVQAMMISGALAGLAGVTYYMGYYNEIVPKSLSSIGYDSISAALLGNIHPLGAIFGATLITIFQNGSVYMSSSIGVEKEMASLITGILLLYSACGSYMQYKSSAILAKYAQKQQKKTKGGDRHG